MTPPSRAATLRGAAFLMATSAIGPGFLTQTAVFTGQLGASFGFAILVSVLLDIGAQVVIWRVLVASERPAQAIAASVAPWLGTLLTVLICAGGLAFNIGNVAGAGLGLQVLTGMDVRVGGLLSACLAVLLFVAPQSGRMMDRVSFWMGVVMIALTAYVAVTSRPPVGEALLRTVLPVRIDVLAIVTLVGGTVGGYIPFAGGHRLLDAGVRGVAALPEATRAAILGIGAASAMRVLLFVAAWGVVAQGVPLAAANPPAAVFQAAAGQLGYRLFGLVLWAAAITSVIGSAYTSVSFLTSRSAVWAARSRALLIGFIAVSTITFVTVGRPVTLLVLVGSLNAVVLPVALGALLVAAARGTLVPKAALTTTLTVVGWLVVAVMAVMGAYSLATGVPVLWRR